MNNVTKKIVACVMAVVMLVGVGMSGQTVNAKKAKKKYNAYLSYVGDSWNVTHYNAHNANVSIKNKKGKAKYTITMKLSNCMDNRSEENKAKKVKNTEELELWIEDILRNHKEKDIKVSNVVVKCDGKKVKLNQKKIKQFSIEGEDEVKRYCVMIFNKNSAKTAKASALNWKNKITVSFNINIKK